MWNDHHHRALYCAGGWWRITARRRPKKTRDLQNIPELIVEMLDKLVHTNMGKYAGKFANYIATLFLFVLISNIIVFGLRSPTADYGVTPDAGADHILP